MKNKANENFRTPGTSGYTRGIKSITPNPMYITAIKYPKIPINFENQPLLNNILIWFLDSCDTSKLFKTGLIRMRLK